MKIRAGLPRPSVELAAKAAGITVDEDGGRDIGSLIGSVWSATTAKIAFGESSKDSGIRWCPGMSG